MLNLKQRLQDLNELAIMDTLPEEDYDNLTKLASKICGTPVSYISFLDDERQWYKSRQGMEITETRVEDALCLRTIEDPKDIVVIPDLRSDESYSENPYVKGAPNVVFYAGVPIYSSNGIALGTICVLDLEPKQLTGDQQESMKILARQVMVLLDLRRKNIILDSKAKLLHEFQEVSRTKISDSTKSIKALGKLLSSFDDLDDRSEITLNLIMESNNDLALLIKDL